MLRRSMLLATLGSTLALGACGLDLMPPPGPSADLPPDAVMGAGDPLRAAVSYTSSTFGAPRRLAGRPAEAARAVAQMEYLAIEAGSNPRLYGASVPTTSQFAAARREWRQALGIAENVPPQPVINALYAAARALDYGQGDPAAALASPVFAPGGAPTLARLGAMPNLPLTNAAAIATSNALRMNEARGSGRF